MILVVFALFYIHFCHGGKFHALTESILNWYEFSPKSLNVDSCLGLRWAAAFDPSNKRLGRVIDECTTTVAEMEPKYWKQTQFVFNLKWKPLESLASRKMVRPPKEYTKTKFDEDFTDNCFSQIPSCRLSHLCVRYIFSPPGRRYFATHQLLLSYAYRINCPKESMFWGDLKTNEKVLCGGIYQEVSKKIELCDMRMEQVLFCGMAGFKGFLSKKWKKHLLDAIDVFKVNDHDFACIKHKTAQLPVYPFLVKHKHKHKRKDPPRIRDPPGKERSVSKHSHNALRRSRRHRSASAHHSKHVHRKSRSRKKHSYRKLRKGSRRKSRYRKKKAMKKRRESLYDAVWTGLNKPRVFQMRKIPQKMSTREKIRLAKKKQSRKDAENDDTLLDLSLVGRRRLRAKTDKFGCDSHTTALLIANFLLMNDL